MLNHKSSFSWFLACLTVGFVWGILLTPNVSQSADIAELVSLLPEDANSVAVVRVTDIMNSPRAQKEEWGKKGDANFISGAGGIPSWIDTMVVGFLVRPAIPEEVWTSAVVTLSEEVSIDDIAKREGGVVEELAGLKAVRGRRDTYVMMLKPGHVAIRRPAIRQEAALWAAAIQSGHSAPQADYLRHAAQSDGELVLAIDLRNTLDPTIVREHLSSDRRYRNVAELPETMTEILMGLQGATLSVQIEDKTHAELRFDFDRDLEPKDGLHLKSFFIDVLQGLGATIEEFETSQIKTEKSTLTLSTTLGDESLLRLFSLITTSPATAQPAKLAPQTDDPASPDTQSQELAASEKYLKAVDRIVTDLQRANNRATDYSRTATWHENFARKIDNLPVQGVDPELLNYGSSVSSKLRALSRSLRGQAVDVNTQQGTLTYDVNFHPGWASRSVWGGVGYRQPSYQITSNLREVREKQAAAISAGVKQRDQIWAMIEDERTAVVKKMREKYGDTFAG